MLKRNFKKIFLFTIIISLSLVLTACWNPFAKDPEKILSEMSVKMNDLKTANSTFTLSLQGEMTTEFLGQKVSQDFVFNLQGQGVEDATDENNPKSDMNLNGSVKFSGTELSFDMDMKLIDEIVYLKFNFSLNLNNLKS